MIEHWKLFLIHILILSTEIAFINPQDLATVDPENPELTLTSIKTTTFTLQWDQDTFPGNEGNNYQVNVTGICVVDHKCEENPCTFVSDETGCFDLSYITACQDITVVVTGKTDEWEISFNLAPNIKNHPELTLDNNLATLSWDGPDPDNSPFTDCATNVEVALKVGSNGEWNKNTVTNEPTNSYSWPSLGDCQHGDLSATIVYLTLAGDYETDIKFDADEHPYYKGAGGVTSITTNQIEGSCDLYNSWEDNCPDEKKSFQVSLDSEVKGNTEDRNYTILDVAYQTYTVSVQASWDGEDTGDNIHGDPIEISPIAPDQPTSIEAVGSASPPKVISVSWEAPTSPTCAGEVLAYVFQCGEEEPVNVEGEDATSPYLLECSKACTEYDIYVAAKGPGGPGEYGKGTGTTGDQAPGKPTNIKEAVDSSSITVSWTLSDTSKSCPLSGHTVTWTPADGDDNGGPHELGGDANSDTITGLTCNKQYTVTVKATAQGGKTSSDEKDFTTDDKAPEAAPGNTECNEVDDPTKLEVTWEKVKNLCDGDLTGYLVSWELNGEAQSYQTDNTSYVIPDLKPCTQYEVTVAAISAKGYIGTKGPASGTTGIDVPGRPVVKIADESSTSSSLFVSWTQDKLNDCEIKNYKVKWSSENGGDDSRLIDGTANSYEITDLICNTEYNIVVTAYTDTNKYNESAAKVGHTDDKAPGVTAITQVSAPDDGDSTQLIVEWSPPTYACTGSSLGEYIVTWTAAGQDEPTGTNTTIDSPYTIEHLVPCTTYAVTVAGTSETGEDGDPGSETANTTVAAPSESRNVREGNITPDSLEVKWDEPSKDPLEGGNPCQITEYQVICKALVGEFVEEQNITDTDQRTCIFENLDSCAFYNITVIAYTDRQGEGTSPVTLETGPDAPPVDDVIIDPESKSANVSWNRPPNTECPLKYKVTYTGTTDWTNNRPDDGDLNPIEDQNATISAELDNLLAYTNYDVCVAVVGGNDTTCRETKTKMEVPSNPRNVVVKNSSVTDTSLTLTWDYPIEENGPLINFHVYWGIDGDDSSNFTRTVEVDKTELSIEDLGEGRYIFTVRAENEKGISASSESNYQDMVGPIVCGGGCIAGIVVGVLLILIAVPTIIFRKKIMKKIKPGPSPVEESPYELRGAAILKSDFRRHVEDMALDRAEGAYQMLNDESQQKNKFAAAKPFNKAKNRFANIHPFDDTRVKLQLMRNGPKGSDYINANHITFPDTFTLNFIATQGPLDSTIYDFYRMIWEHNIYDAVMLCNLVEKGKTKCAQYWTEKGERSIEFGDFKISCQVEEQDVSGTFITRYIDISKDGQHRMLKQHHFTAWPDFGVPDSEEVLLTFLASVKKTYNQSGKSVVTHCSAGVGRTGTFIALWVLTGLLEENKTAKSIDVHKVALMMREGRSDMIQTKDQYLYLHKCLLKYMEDGGVSFHASNKDEEEPIYGNVNGAYQQ